MPPSAGTVALGGGEYKIIIWGIFDAQMVLKKLPQGHESSEYVLSFQIGQREGGFYSARTDRIIEPPSTALVYRLAKHPPSSGFPFGAPNGFKNLTRP